MRIKTNQVPQKLNLFNHFGKLIFFTMNRFKGDNYRKMREYFADILIMELEEFVPLWDKKVLDVGGAKGEFCQVLNIKRNCDATNLDPYPEDYIWPKTTVSFADNMPFDDNEFDVVICRGVLEHISLDKQQPSLNEIFRVTKRGGFSYILIPPWYNPHAGHLLKPFHVLPFPLAKSLRQLVFRNKITSNSYAEEKLFPITFAGMVQIIRSSGFKIIATKDTHFKLHFLTRIPILREIAVASALFILKKE